MNRSEAKKGVSEACGYFMGYYTIWLALVKKYFVPFWELREETFGRPYRRFKTRSLKNQGCGTRLLPIQRREL